VKNGDLSSLLASLAGSKADTQAKGTQADCPRTFKDALATNKMDHVKLKFEIDL
jgi:hypothetical protein